MRVLHILRALPLTAALALTPLIRLPAQASSQNASANSGVGVRVRPRNQRSRRSTSTTTAAGIALGTPRCLATASG